MCFFFFFTNLKQTILAKIALSSWTKSNLFQWIQLSTIFKTGLAAVVHARKFPVILDKLKEEILSTNSLFTFLKILLLRGEQRVCLLKKVFPIQEVQIEILSQQRRLKLSQFLNQVDEKDPLKFSEFKKILNDEVSNDEMD